jgi:hypothetical protein
MPDLHARPPGPDSPDAVRVLGVEALAAPVQARHRVRLSRNRGGRSEHPSGGADGSSGDRVVRGQDERAPSDRVFACPEMYLQRLIADANWMVHENGAFELEIDALITSLQDALAVSKAR